MDSHQGGTFNSATEPRAPGRELGSLERSRGKLLRLPHHLVGRHT